MKVHSEEAQTGMRLGASRQVINMSTSRSAFLLKATEGPTDILDSMSRRPTERNAVDMPGSAAAVEAS
jgi:hypothetical protein